MTTTIHKHGTLLSKGWFGKCGRCGCEFEVNAPPDDHGVIENCPVYGQIRLMPCPECETGCRMFRYLQGGSYTYTLGLLKDDAQP